MATGQTILNIMEDLNGELQLQTGEVDVAKGLRSVNASQDLVEAIISQHPDMLGGGIGTVATVKDVESTAYPSGLLRLDSLWYVNTDLDPDRPGWKLKPLRGSGEHISGSGWLRSLAYGTTSGKPRAYWTNGTNIYWDPLPSGAYTVRWYGLQAAADVTAAGTFAYNDLYLYPVALLASRILKVAVDDPPDHFISLTKELINPLIAALSHYNRDGAHGMVYEHRHDT